MRILHVTPTYFPARRYGGPIWSVHGLAKAQAAIGHQVEVFTTNVDGHGVSDVPTDEPVTLDGVKVHYFRVGWPRRLFRSKSMGRALVRCCKNFDIIHLHSVYSWPTTAAARVARSADVPYVLAPRGMLWKELIQARSKYLKRIWIVLFERYNVENAAAIHVTANIEGSKLAELRFKLPPVKVLPNGVDVPSIGSRETISPDILDATSQAGYVLSFGRINWKKNNKALIAAIAETDGARAIIAGNEEDNHSLVLAELAEELGVRERVSILPRQISGVDKETLFSRAAIFVLPSISENFGNTVLEAMVRGVPVLASQQAGASQIVSDVGCGQVCRTNARDLASHIRDMLSYPTLLKGYSAAGSAAAKNGYIWERIGEKSICLYNEIVESPEHRTRQIESKRENE